MRVRRSARGRRSTVSSAQSRRRTTVPIEWAVKARGDQEGAGDEQDPADEDRRPDRGDGRHEDRDAADRRSPATPTAISAFQLFASPSRTSGSIDAPPISMQTTLSAATDDLERQLLSDDRQCRIGCSIATLDADPGWCSRLARLVLVQEARVRVLPPELAATVPASPPAPRGTLPPFGAGLQRRAARRGDAEHAHRLQAEAELLAALGGARRRGRRAPCTRSSR